MTAVLEDLRSLTEDEVVSVLTGEDDASRAAAAAELRRREHEHDARQRRQHGETGLRDMVHAQYEDAVRECNGTLMNARGQANEHLTDEALWYGPRWLVEPYISEELRNYWLDNPRRTISDLRAQEAASRLDERETAAAETAATEGTERKDMIGRMIVHEAVRSAQNAQRHPGGMTQEGMNAVPAVQRTRQRLEAQRKQRQAVAGVVQAAQTRQAHQQVASRDPAEAAQPLAGTVTAAPGRQVPDAPVLLRMVLDEMGLLLSDYVEFPSKSAVIAVVLWIAQAAARDADHNPIWYAYPRLLLTSRQNGSGKSSVGDLARALLQCRAGRMSKVTPYGLTKVFGTYHETAILDDAQNTFRSDKAGAELLSVMINGYTDGATWVTGKSDGKVEDASGPMMIVGKDDLITKRAESLADLLVRSVIVRLERPRLYMPELNRQAIARAQRIGAALVPVMGALKPQLEAAADELAAELVGTEVTDPNGPRTAQIFRPLEAVARIAGGPWPAAIEQAKDELAAASGDLYGAAGILDGLADGPDGPVSVRRSFWDDAPGDETGWEG